MPSGYTEDLYKGMDVSFEEFAMKCARAFGALVMLRDDPLDAPIPEFTVADYYGERLQKAEEAIATAYARSMDEWAQLERTTRAEANDARDASLAEEAARLDRYEEMLVSVRAWIPPTAEHDERKKFMIQQLEESIKFDGGSERWYKPTEPRTPAEYRRKVLDDLHSERETARQSLREEEARVAGRNRWVRDLRVSLGLKVGA